MPRLITYVEVGICSGYQDGDYRINCSVADLSRESFQELRLAMIYAIYQMEDMWRREQEKKNLGQQAKPAAHADEVKK